MSPARTVFAVAISLAFAACTDVPVALDPDLEPAFARGARGGGARGGGARGGGDAPVDPASAISDMIEAANAGLAAAGAGYRVAMAEYVTGEGDEAGATVFSRDIGNKQLEFDFVPFDARRVPWSGPVDGATDNITYAVDQTGDAVPPVGGLTAGETDAAIDRAMATWDAQTCSDLPITRNDDFGLDLGFVAFFFINGQGGPDIVADIQHAGWLDINFAGGIVGATFTLVFVPNTDIDNNGKIDVAFREIYYDPSFSWADDGVIDIDVEAVALHEVGHGLSQAHFGNLLIKNDGSLLRAPAAVMNPIILDQTRTLLGTDEGGHCTNWSDWPNI